MNGKRRARDKLARDNDVYSQKSPFTITTSTNSIHQTKEANQVIRGSQKRHRINMTERLHSTTVQSVRREIVCSRCVCNRPWRHAHLTNSQIRAQHLVSYNFESYPRPRTFKVIRNERHVKRHKMYSINLKLVFNRIYCYTGLTTSCPPKLQYYVLSFLNLPEILENIDWLRWNKRKPLK